MTLQIEDREIPWWLHRGGPLMKRTRGSLDEPSGRGPHSGSPNKLNYGLMRDMTEESCDDFLRRGPGDPPWDLTKVGSHLTRHSCWIHSCADPINRLQIPIWRLFAETNLKTLPAIELPTLQFNRISALAASPTGSKNQMSALAIQTLLYIPRPGDPLMTSP